jgi:hypothetical protein
MSILSVVPKDPNSVEPYFFVWCDRDGTNTGGATDEGELQGATISSITVTAATGLTLDSSNKNAVTIRGVSYSANTVVTAWLSGGTNGEDYDVLCRIVTSDSRTLDQTIRVPVRST